MKKQVLLLMTGLLFVCSGAFAQQEWKELVENGDFEGSGFSSFSIQDYRDGSSQDLTADDIVADDNDANNHCAKITLTITPRYCYFIIKLAEPLSEGDIFKFSMRAKTSSERDIPIKTDNMGNIVVKTGGDWSTFTYEGVVSSELAGSQAITLKFGPAPRKNDIFYFDDISMKVTDGNVPIEFADAKVKEICVSNWDTSGDGELSYAEAAAVGDLGDVFRYNQEITSFNELQYFIGLTWIRDWAFSGTTLTSIIIPNNVGYIEQYAFGFCYNLTSVTIPNSVTTIGENAFGYCNSLTSVTIPNSVTSIGYSAFKNCSGLTSVTIPKSVTTIGDDAFQYCGGLTSIKVENGNPKYDSRDNCNALIETESNTLIVGCMNTVIPNSVTTIGKEAFYNCRGLTSVTIPNSVTNIEDGAFIYCNLASIKVESGNTRYDSRDNCNAIIETESNTLVLGCMNTIIPNSVTSIGSRAFFGSSLTSLTIPNSVTTIGDEAFSGCLALEEVTIGSGVTKIGNCAFEYCRGLKEIRSMITDPFTCEIGPGWLDWGPSLAVVILYVPAGTKEKYESTPAWNLFQNVVEMDITPVEEGQTIDLGTEIDENTNLEGTVVDNVFVNISNGDGGFDPVEGCLIVSKPTDDSAINGKDIFGDDFKDNYTGIVFKVNEGKGSIKVVAETQGNMVLKVKIGNSEPIEMELDGKLKVKFPYDVSEETLVYIYGGLSSAGAKATGARRAPSATDLLKIYGFEIVSDPSGIGAIENGNQLDAPVYNLNGQRVNIPGKGVYIKNGRKVLMK